MITTASPNWAEILQGVGAAVAALLTFGTVIFAFYAVRQSSRAVNFAEHSFLEQTKARLDNRAPVVLVRAELPDDPVYMYGLNVSAYYQRKPLVRVDNVGDKTVRVDIEPEPNDDGSLPDLVLAPGGHVSFRVATVIATGGPQESSEGDHDVSVYIESVPPGVRDVYTWCIHWQLVWGAPHPDFSMGERPTVVREYGELGAEV